MKPTIIALSFCLFYNAHAQINWKKTTAWKAYKVEASKIFSLNVDALAHLKSYSLQKDSIMYFLDSTIALPSDRHPIWMGGLLGSCSYKGQIRKIAISSYGGFFFDQTSGIYYQLPEEKKDEWFSYINNCVSSL